MSEPAGVRIGVVGATGAVGTVTLDLLRSRGHEDVRIFASARLQAATKSDKPIFLSINAHAGHGIGSALSIRVNQEADIYAFLFDQLGMHLPQK